MASKTMRIDYSLILHTGTAVNSESLYFFANIAVPLLDTCYQEIIIPVLMRWCWNWQTGMVEGHVPQGVWVQLPPSALTAVRRFVFLTKRVAQGGGIIKHRLSFQNTQGI